MDGQTVVTAPPDSTRGTADRSTGALVRDVVTGTQSLVRQELTLAKLELKETAQAGALAAGAGVAGAVLGLFSLGFLGAAGAKALEEVLVPWAAWLIVAGVFLLLTAIALLVARGGAARASDPLDRTKTSILEDVSWARRLLRR